MNGIEQDLRHALRQPRKNPGFFSMPVLTLALGSAPIPQSSAIVPSWVTRSGPEHIVSFVSERFVRTLSHHFPEARFWITSRLPTRTKPLVRRTLPRG